MKRLLLLVVLCTLLFSLSQAQENLSWKQHEKLAQKLEQANNYGEAAMHYEQAWKAKQSKKELIYKAAENYYLVRDFKKAAEAYSNVKEQSDKFDKAGLKYARCLKQSGDYDSAIREFVYFISKYEGEDKATLSAQVQTEMNGCELGLKQQNELDNSPIFVEHMNENINTVESEFAPIAFSDDILYFSSLKLDKAKIFRSQRSNGVWSKAQLPRGFAKFKDEHFCNGSFSQDYNRFYFTICETDQVWGGLTSRCDIYVTKRQKSSWTNPQKLPDSINKEGFTNTHPFSVVKDDKEVLYFSSNRTGSVGDMDIWYSERAVDSEDTDFGAPKNAGTTINTTRDEITPFYDNENGTLYFSSNGHLTVGGYDIMKATGHLDQFDAPQNLGFPINSPADDNYYVHLNGGAEGFLVSNRTYGMDKITTTQEDIFAFGSSEQQLMVKGSILDKETNLPIENVEVALYEVQGNGLSKLWTSKNFSDGNYMIKLLPGKNYELRVEQEDYFSSTQTFNTHDESKFAYAQNFTLNPITRNTQEGIVSTNEGIIDNTSQPTETTTSPSAETYVENTYTETVPTETVVETYSQPSTVVETNESVSSYDTYSTPSYNETTTYNESSNYNTSSSNYNESSYTTPSSSYTESSYTAPATTTMNTSSNYSSSAELPSVIKSSDNTSSSYSSGSYNSSYNSNSYDTSNLPAVIRSTDPGDSGYESSSYSSSSTGSPSGSYYKIQLIAVKTYRPDHKRYRNIKNLARIDTEYFSDQDVTRVLLSDFFSKDEARDMLEQVQERGFESAFIVKYADGRRVRRVRD